MPSPPIDVREDVLGPHGLPSASSWNRPLAPAEHGWVQPQRLVYDGGQILHVAMVRRRARVLSRWIILVYLSLESAIGDLVCHKRIEQASEGRRRRVRARDNRENAIRSDLVECGRVALDTCLVDL